MLRLFYGKFTTEKADLGQGSGGRFRPYHRVESPAVKISPGDSTLYQNQRLGM